jgi:hypothetical protein
MRDQWFGDNKDLIKWGVLLELARRYDVEHIPQVLYLTETTWEGLEIDDVLVELPTEVVKHFRDATSVSQMQCAAHIEVFSKPFADRNEYHQELLEQIQSRPKRPGIIFLDPDTGLQPAGAAGLKHVLDSELTKIWQVLCPSDILVFYQHQTNRNSTLWVDSKKAQFERALGVQEGSAKLAHAPGIARDVAFFFIEKKGEQGDGPKPERRSTHPKSAA